MRKYLIIAGALVVAAVIAGPVSAAASSAVPDTKTMALRLSDLPAGFALDEHSYADNTQVAKESKVQPLADFVRRGPITGNEATFSREGITGILQIESSSSTYKTTKVGGPPTDQLVIRLAAGQSLDTARARRDRRASTSASCGCSPTGRTSSSSRSATRSRPSQAISDRLAARGDVVSVEPDEMMQPLAGADGSLLVGPVGLSRPGLGASTATTFPPPGTSPPGRRE